MPQSTGVHTSRIIQNPSTDQQTQLANELQRAGLTIYRIRPPEWRLPTQINQPELGYPGLHPPHVGQHEDAITKSLVQWGFSAQTLVATESFSAHQMIYKKLTDDSSFKVSSAALAALVEARRRYYAISNYDTKSTIKVPGRVTLNDQKRENWLRDLADTSVPLLKLSKNVPHGFKGEKLLEMLVNRKLDSSRATWYMRLIGLNEINSQRNKNELSHIRYTLSFTSEVCQFLQKQLAEVTVPLQTNLSSSTTSLLTTSSRLAGMNVRSKPRSSTLSDPETRKLWVAKWDQSCLLLKRLYFESLLDQPTFFKWIVDHLKVANLAQINFLLEIHHSVSDRFNLSSNLVRAFVEACLSQIRFIGKQTATPYLSKLQHRLKLAVQTAFIFCPDNFAWPDLWMSNKLLLEEIILSNASAMRSTNVPLKQGLQAHQLRETLKVDFFAVNWRVNELVGDAGIGTGIVGNIFTRRALLVQILDSYTEYLDSSKLYYSYFLNPSVAGNIIVSFKDRLEVLLSWATTPLRTSDKRVYLVSTTLSYVKRDRKKNEDEFQNILVGWLEQLESIDGGDLLVRLFSELSRRNIFSYGAYVQRMVAKGDTECDILSGKASGLQALLSEWMPLVSSKAFGERRSPMKRSPVRDSARNGLMAIIADLNSAIAFGDLSRLIHLLRRRLDVSQPTSANRKILAEILPNSLLNLIGELSFTTCATSGFSSGNISNHPQIVSALLTWAIQLLESSQAYTTLFEIIQRIVQIDLSRIEILQIYDKSHADINLSVQSAFCYLKVICMAASNNKEIFEINSQLTDLTSQLFTIYVHFRRLVAGNLPVVRGFVRCLRYLVIECDPLDRQIIEVLDKENHPVFDEMALGRSAAQSLSSPTAEILQILRCPSVKEISQLVLKYWEEHRLNMHWGPLLWRSLITAIKIYYQEDCKGDHTPHENWWLIRETIMQFCEDLDMLYEDGFAGCIMRSEDPTYAYPDDEQLSDGRLHTSIGEKVSGGDGSEQSSAESPTQKTISLRNSRSLCPLIRLLLVELIANGLIGIEVGLEEYVIKPLATHIPQLLAKQCGDINSVSSASNLPHGSWMARGEEALRQAEEVCKLVHEVLNEKNISQDLQAFSSPDKEPAGMITSLSQSHLFGHLNFTTQGSPDIPDRLKNVEHEIEEYVKVWRLSVERRLWFEQSDEGLAFCSRLLLSLLNSIKAASEIPIFDSETLEEDSAQESCEQLAKKILELVEHLRSYICQGLILLRQTILVHPAAFLDPIFNFLNGDNMGTIFYTKLIQSIDELLPYQHSKELLNQKYPYLESIFKDTNVFNHSARTKQFQLHIRLLMMDNPPQMPAVKEVTLDLTSILGCLVEVMAKRLHLTDSKDASPFFLDCLPAPVAEALIIKLSLYLGMSICKLLGSNPSDSAPEVSRIHHICRCITALTNQLTVRACQSNDDITIKVIGGCSSLPCNATVESYMSYWQQLKSGLFVLNSRLANASGSAISNSRRVEYRIIRALLHSAQVVLWSLPGLTQHLGTLKQMIAEIWIEISLRVQGDSALQNQIIDTIGVLLFPTVPDDSTMTAVVGIMRKRFHWLYFPILDLDDGSNLVPSNRLRYLLGSSLRGSSTTFQERSKDGAVKFVEDKPWEELEKMDMSGPGFVSIDALKCQTLSQVAPTLDLKPMMDTKSHPRRFGCEGEDGIREETRRGSERGDDALPMNSVEGEAEKEFTRGERENFEHEVVTDDFSTIPLHFFRSLFPPQTRLIGQGHEMQKSLQTNQTEQSQPYTQNPSRAPIATEQDSSSRNKKRKSIPLSISPPALNPITAPENTDSQISSTSGPTLRSARSTRKKSSAGPSSHPPSGPSSKRSKKR